MKTNQEIMNAAAGVAMHLQPHMRIFGIPYSGIPAAYAVKSFGALLISDNPEDADVLICDCPSKTSQSYKDRYPDKPIYYLFQTREVMPWKPREVPNGNELRTKIQDLENHLQGIMTLLDTKE